VQSTMGVGDLTGEAPGMLTLTVSDSAALTEELAAYQAQCHGRCHQPQTIVIWETVP